jgi:hypothetical protein
MRHVLGGAVEKHEKPSPLSMSPLSIEADFFRKWVGSVTDRASVIGFSYEGQAWICKIHAQLPVVIATAVTILLPLLPCLLGPSNGTRQQRISLMLIMFYVLCLCYLPLRRGHAVTQLVEALRYKPEGRGFDSGRTMVLGSTQPLTEMSTRDSSWGVRVAGA